MPRALWWSWGGGLFLMSEVLMYSFAYRSPWNAGIRLAPEVRSAPIRRLTELRARFSGVLTNQAMFAAVDWTGFVRAAAVTRPGGQV